MAVPLSFTINATSVLNAWDITTEYVDRAPYWEGVGQSLFSTIDEKADELANGGDSSEIPSEPSEESSEIPSEPSEESSEVPSEPSEESSEVPSEPSEESSEVPSEESSEVPSEPSEDSSEPAGDVSSEQHTFDATLLTMAADKEAMTNDQFTDDYFSVTGNVVKRGTAPAVKAVEIAKNSGGAIVFTVTGTAEVKVGAMSTGGSNTSPIAIVDANGNVVANNEGLSTVTGRTITELTYTLPAGTYSIVSPTDAANKRGVQVVYVDLLETISGAGGEELELNGIHQAADSKYYYYVDGVIDTNVNGLVPYEDGLWYYFENGVWINDKYDLVEYNGGKFFVVNGLYESSISGLQLIGDNFYFLSYGQLQDYTGLALYDGEFFYVENGVLAINYNGLLDYDGSKFLIAAGRIVGDYTGLYNDTVTGDWYYIVYGQVQTDYVGLVLYDGAWFHLVDGKVASDYTGLVLYDGAWFYIVYGKVASDYTGTVEFAGTVFNVVNGQVVA